MISYGEIIPLDENYIGSQDSSEGYSSSYRVFTTFVDIHIHTQGASGGSSYAQDIDVVYNGNLTYSSEGSGNEYRMRTVEPLLFDQMSWYNIQTNYYIQGGRTDDYARNYQTIWDPNGIFDGGYTEGITTGTNSFSASGYSQAELSYTFNPTGTTYDNIFSGWGESASEYHAGVTYQDNFTQGYTTQSYFSAYDSTYYASQGSTVNIIDGTRFYTVSTTVGGTNYGDNTSTSESGSFIDYAGTFSYTTMEDTGTITGTTLTDTTSTTQIITGGASTTFYSIINTNITNYSTTTTGTYTSVGMQTYESTYTFGGSEVFSLTVSYTRTNVPYPWRYATVLIPNIDAVHNEWLFVYDPSFEEVPVNSNETFSFTELFHSVGGEGTTIYPKFAAEPFIAPVVDQTNFFTYTSSYTTYSTVDSEYTTTQFESSTLTDTSYNSSVLPMISSTYEYIYNVTVTTDVSENDYSYYYSTRTQVAYSTLTRAEFGTFGFTTEDRSLATQYTPILKTMGNSDKGHDISIIDIISKFYYDTITNTVGTTVLFSYTSSSETTFTFDGGNSNSSGITSYAGASSIRGETTGRSSYISFRISILPNGDLWKIIPAYVGPGASFAGGTGYQLQPNIAASDSVYPGLSIDSGSIPYNGYYNFDMAGDLSNHKVRCPFNFWYPGIVTYGTALSDTISYGTGNSTEITSSNSTFRYKWETGCISNATCAEVLPVLSVTILHDTTRTSFTNEIYGVGDTINTVQSAYHSTHILTLQRPFHIGGRPHASLNQASQTFYISGHFISYNSEGNTGTTSYDGNTPLEANYDVPLTVLSTWKQFFVFNSATATISGIPFSGFPYAGVMLSQNVEGSSSIFLGF